MDDDDHPWQHLQTTFKDLPADDVKQSTAEVKQQQAPGEGFAN